MSSDLSVKNIISYAQLKEDIRSALFGADFDLNAAILAYPAGTVVPFTDVTPALRPPKRALSRKRQIPLSPA